MERTLASPADAGTILKLYELRTEPLMRQARAWMTGDWWPATVDEFFSVASNPADPHNAFFRQVITYWEMAAAMVLHGAVSSDLFVDCNAEGFFLLAKFAPILGGIRERNPGFHGQDFRTAHPVYGGDSTRYEVMVRKNVEARRTALKVQTRTRQGKYFYPDQTLIAWGACVKAMSGKRMMITRWKDFVPRRPNI